MVTIPRSEDFCKVLNLCVIPISFKCIFKLFGITPPRPPTTAGITFVFALQSLDISFAKSWYFSCFIIIIIIIIIMGRRRNFINNNANY